MQYNVLNTVVKHTPLRYFLCRAAFLLPIIVFRSEADVRL